MALAMGRSVLRRAGMGGLRRPRISRSQHLARRWTRCGWGGDASAGRERAGDGSQGLTSGRRGLQRHRVVELGLLCGDRPIRGVRRRSWLGIRRKGLSPVDRLRLRARLCATFLDRTRMRTGVPDARRLQRGITREWGDREVHGWRQLRQPDGVRTGGIGRRARARSRG
jgi:hypothetical protein